MNKDGYKIDLHTHSIISYDGGITTAGYTKIFEKGILDCVAITDHNETRFARMLHEQFGEKIIVGEEISTTAGDLIGLFLTETISPNMTIAETVAAIHLQGGLVYIPHPFETRRKGLQKEVLEEIHEEIDIVEVYNGRALFRGKPVLAESFAKAYQFPEAASSDAHGYAGMGRTYSIVSQIPTPKNVKKLLQTASLHKQHAPLLSLFSPLINKIKNKFILSV
jgi:predicted metal-dependent phosphoesterase TrpH